MFTTFVKFSRLSYDESSQILVLAMLKIRQLYSQIATEHLTMNLFYFYWIAIMIDLTVGDKMSPSRIISIY